jgi:integrase/recombinase XerD
MQKIRDSLKLIQRNGEGAANDLSPFSYEDFEKNFIYNNPLFRQRKYIKDVVVKATANDDFDYSPFTPVDR